MEDPLRCPNNRRGTCPRSDPVILEEGREHIQIGCKTCRAGYVVTLPEGKRHARYENRIKELKRIQEQQKAVESRAKPFYAPTGGWR